MSNSAKKQTSLYFKDLKPGDVILSRGIGTLSDLIAWMDGSQYSHAALFDGEHFVQATMDGVKASPLKRIVEHQKYLHAYRFHDQNGQPLDSENLPSKPITEQANVYVNEEYAYAYDELLLLALVFILRSSVAPKWQKDVIEVLGGKALTELKEIVEKILKKEVKAMICSELVASSYWEPSDNIGMPYGLQIQVQNRRLQSNQSEPLFSQQEQQQYEQLVADIENILSDLQPQLSTQLNQVQSNLLTSGNDSSGMTLIAGSTFLPANCVSPGDLEKSPNLTYLGVYME